MSQSITDPDTHVASWQASGLSQAAYCRQEGLPYHRFREWLRRRPGPGPGEVANGFVEVRRPNHAGVVWCEWPNGARLVFSDRVDPAWLVQVVRSLVAPC
jgi:hypothetical protein